MPSISLTILIISTRLSPYAVMAACDALIAYPNILAARNPCPPHLYLIVAMLLYECQPTRVLSTQQIISKSDSWPFGFEKTCLA